MLYDSTRGLLQSIVRALQTGEETKWADQTESGNACLFEMHQMCGPLYKAYKSDRISANSVAQETLPVKLKRAIPHVRTMVVAIRHKNQPQALESGKLALAEMTFSLASEAPTLPQCGTEARKPARKRLGP
jgi:hypothetical protein